ncbi:MAG: ABC transporter permease [Treponema sp.]|jgi:ABC-type spermidine/putrescine transport system permease subunit I|nr:ABC transporter permease [Treponema sp.]
MQKSGKLRPYLMVFPAVSLMALVVVYPIVDTIIRSFRDSQGGWTLQHYYYFFSSPEARESLCFTLAEALITMILGMALSFLLALYLRFSTGPIAGIMGRLYLLPRFIPGITAVYAVMNMIRDSGFIHRVMRLFGLSYKPGLLFDLKGIILCNLWFTVPFGAMLLSAALSKVEDTYIESARDAGCSWPVIFWRIILPITGKDLVVAATFILMGQIGSFTIPYLTGPNNPKMLGILLYQQVGVYLDYGRAAALSVLMFLLCLAGAVVYIKTNLKETAWETK